jgi:hypothetical protein
MNLGASIGGNGAAKDEDVIARLLVSGGLLRRRRVRRLLLARLLSEAREAGEEPEFEGEEFEAEEGGGVSDRGIVKFLIASGVLRRRRMRKMILAHLLGERGGMGVESEFGEHEGFEGFGGFEGVGEGGVSDRKIARFLIASGILRRRIIRKMVMAHLVREHGEGIESEFGEHEGVGGGFGGEETPTKLVRFLIASGILRRQRIRRMVLAHLLREHGEGGEHEHEHEEFEGEEAGGGEDRRIVRQLVASGVLRKRRIRRMLLARLLRERGGEFGGDEMEGEEFGEAGWGGGVGHQRGGFEHMTA